MKHLKKFFAAAVALFMALVLATPAFASTQTVGLDPADADNASITINNPAMGETYNVIQLFDATLKDGHIAYKGTIPASLTDCFEYTNGENTTNGYVALKEGVSDADLFAALETWAASATVTNSAESDGSDTLTFAGLPYGYYVVTTTHQDKTTHKANITVDSTNPNAQINDKNETQIIAKKEVNGTSYSIGDTITYTATFTTTNYYGSGAGAKKITQYVIKDTLPEFLSNVAITGITIGGDDWADAPEAFDTNKQIVIPWVNETTGDSLYANGAQIVVTYTAELTSTVNVNAANTNTVSITPYGEPDEGGEEPEPLSEPFEDSQVVTTYAAALKKVDPEGNALVGAKFAANGLTVEKTADGVYTVTSYDATSKTLGTAMETDGDGKLYIVGLAKDVSLSVTETEAPKGFNKLSDPVALPPQILEQEVYKTSGMRYYDEDGNLVSETSTHESSLEVVNNLSDLDANAVEVENNNGAVLPSTGGIGTTLFYVIGGILVAGAAIALVVKNRVAKIEE